MGTAVVVRPLCAASLASKLKRKVSSTLRMVVAISPKTSFNRVLAASGAGFGGYSSSGGVKLASVELQSTEPNEYVSEEFNTMVAGSGGGGGGGGGSSAPVFDAKYGRMFFAFVLSRSALALCSRLRWCCWVRARERAKKARKADRRLQKEIKQLEQRVKQLDATIGVLLNKGQRLLFCPPVSRLAKLCLLITVVLEPSTYSRCAGRDRH